MNKPPKTRAGWKALINRWNSNRNGRLIITKRQKVERDCEFEKIWGFAPGRDRK